MTTRSIINNRARSHGTSLVLAAGAVTTLAIIGVVTGSNIISVHGLMAGDTRTLNILLTSRIPRTVALVLAGSSMAVAGMIMQMLSRNRFVEPGTAGPIESATDPLCDGHFDIGEPPISSAV